MQAGDAEVRPARTAIQAKSIEQVYQQVSNRRNAITIHYLKNSVLRISDPATYTHYQKELRTLNKRLRTIRECLLDNPLLASDGNAVPGR